MARLRTIKPGFFTNDSLGECQPLARLLFAGLWCHADRAGRLEDRPKRLKVEVLPYDECDIEALLGELVAHGFIHRYEAMGRRYIAIPTWAKHQNPHIKEGASTIPAPSVPGQNDARLSSIEGEHHASTVQAPDKHSSSPAVLVFGDLGLGSGNLPPTVPTEPTEGAPVAANAAPDAPLPDVDTALVSIVPGPKGRSVRVYEPPTAAAAAAPFEPDHQALWDAFTDVFGAARGKTETQRRGEACKRAKEARASPEEIRLAAEHWPNVMGDATLTELGIVANLGKLLHGPQVNGRSNGVTHGLQQTIRQSASLPPDDMALMRAAKAARRPH